MLFIERRHLLIECGVLFAIFALAFIQCFFVELGVDVIIDVDSVVLFEVVCLAEDVPCLFDTVFQRVNVNAVVLVKHKC